MTPDLLLRTAIDPGLEYLARFAIRSDDRARHLLSAIALQESGLCARCQVIAGGGRGPARGWWQFERGGGVAGVLRHPLSRSAAEQACRDFLVPAESAAVWEAIEHADVLAAIFARLLLLTDAKALPGQHETQAAWDYYKRNWRPGKPHPEFWGIAHSTALAAVGALPRTFATA